MTELEIIDKRLSLFPEYLRYYLDDLYKTPFVLDIDSMPLMDARDLMKTFNELGYLMVSAQIEAPLNFDGWLLHNGYSELSDLKPVPMYAIGIDPYYDAEKWVICPG